MIVDVFRGEVENIFKEEKSKGNKYVDINSGDLHRKVGGYPGKNHSMPTCCDVLRSFMKSNDEILQSPPKGKGATLTIRYFL